MKAGKPDISSSMLEAWQSNSMKDAHIRGRPTFDSRRPWRARLSQSLSLFTSHSPIHILWFSFYIFHITLPIQLSHICTDFPGAIYQFIFSWLAFRSYIFTKADKEIEATFADWFSSFKPLNIEFSQAGLWAILFPPGLMLWAVHCAFQAQFSPVHRKLENKWFRPGSSLDSRLISHLPSCLLDNVPLMTPGSHVQINSLLP